MGSRKWGRFVPIIFAPLLALVLITLALVSPVANFPLNDDWVYAKTVQKLLDQHRLELHPFAAVNTFGQTFIGALFCLPFGFNFTALRLSTLTLALVCAWATARAGRTLGLSIPWALLCGMLIVANPLVINLSYTFMTDVPLLAFTTLAGWFYLRAIISGRWIDVLLGSTFAAYAFLIRQLGLTLPAAYVAVAFVQWWRERKPPPISHVAALAVPWVLTILFLVYWHSTHGSQYSMPVPAPSSVWDRTGTAIRYAAKIILYLGLFLGPLLSAVVCSRFARPNIGRSRSKRSIVTAALFVAVVLTLAGGRMPLLTNMLRDLGVGPFTIAGAYYKGKIWAPVSIGAWWWAITVVCGAAGGVLIADVFARTVRPLIREPLAICWAAIRVPRERLSPAWKYLRDNVRVLKWVERPSANAVDHPSSSPFPSPENLFLCLWAVLMLVVPYNPYVPVYFDRYLLPAIPPLALFVGTALAPRTKCLFIAAGACALFYVFSVVCLQDYLAWNRARWAAIEKLRTAYGVADEHIDGGYEFNGMYTSDEEMRRLGTTDFNRQRAPEFVFDIQYRVAFNPGADFQAIDRITYFSWLGMKTREVLILRRQPGAS